MMDQTKMKFVFLSCTNPNVSLSTSAISWSHVPASSWITNTTFQYTERGTEKK